MAQRTIRVGVAGVGNVAERTYLPGMLKIPGVEIVAVCDAVKAQATRIQTMFQIPESYVDIEEMVRRSDIEAVVVLSSIPTHAALSLAAIRAGKHVYTEKPMATTMADADRLIAEASAAGVKLTCAPPTILNPTLQLMKETIEEGAIGKVCFVRAHASHSGPGRFLWRTTDISWFYKEHGGPLFDLGVYPIQELTYILGPAKRVTAMTGTSIPQITARSGPIKGQKIDVEVADNNLILLDFGNATFAFIDATYCVWAARGPRREFYGSDGVLTVNSASMLSSSPSDAAPFEIYREDYQFGVGGWMSPTAGGLAHSVALAQGRQRALQEQRLAVGVGHLVDCILEDQQPLISGERGRHVLEIMLGAMESGRTGRAVELTTTC